MTGAIATPIASRPEDDGQGHVRDEPRLDRPARRAIEEVAEVGGQRDQHRVDHETAAGGKARGRHEHDRDRRRRRRA